MCGVDGEAGGKIWYLDESCQMEDGMTLFWDRKQGSTASSRGGTLGDGCNATTGYKGKPLLLETCPDS